MTACAGPVPLSHPNDRAKSLGVFRLWRDLGYAIGAIITGIIADAIGINASIIVIGGLTLASGLVIYYRMKCNRRFFRLTSWLFNKVSAKKMVTEYRQQCVAFK